MRAVTSDDEALMILRFRDGEWTRGATSLVSMSMVEQGRAEHRIEIFGTRGALAIEDSGQLWRAQTGGGRWEKVETDSGPLAEGMRDSGWARGFTAFAPRIVEALREGRNRVEGAATFEDGYRTQLVLDAARRSSETGRWEAIEN
jgi:predicted dehydrogenase